MHEDSLRGNAAVTIEHVVENNVCVGCGACNVATGGRIPVVLRPQGYYQADLAGVSQSDLDIGSRVCPFSDSAKNETELAQTRYPELAEDPRIGKYGSLLAGRIKDDSQIPASSSGGITTWVLRRLLETGEVDGVIHVGNTDQPMFGYVVSETLDELQDGRKSKYHPAKFAEAIRSVRGNGKKYAFVGVPCAIKAVRLLREGDETLAAQLKYLVGIVCGHLKSTAYAESFAWQLGVPPQKLDTVDFRIKDPSRTSREYKFGARAKGSDVWQEAPTLSLIGGSWGHAVFQLNACNYCDDIFAEAGDIAIGDAWLSKYEIDWRGTNVVVARDQKLAELLSQGAQDGDLTLDVLGPDDVARTQAGNFRHRREGLAVRLADDRDAGRWSPTKRVAPGRDHVTPDRVELIRRRRALSETTHEAFENAKAADDLQVYLNAVRPLIEEYQQATRMRFSTRVKNRLKRDLWKVLRKVKAS